MLYSNPFERGDGFCCGLQAWGEVVLNGGAVVHQIPLMFSLSVWGGEGSGRGCNAILMWMLLLSLWGQHVLFVCANLEGDVMAC